MSRDPDCYDADVHLGAAAWFKTDGGLHLIERTQFYLVLPGAAHEAKP